MPGTYLSNLHTVKFSAHFMQPINHKKIKQTATARNKNEYYRSKYASTGNEILTECCLPKDEPVINFSQLNKHCTGHEN